MGKKKAQKTKEISVAIAEASMTGDESKQQQTQPRKRGRPRKMVEKTEIQEDKQEILHQPARAAQGKDSSIKKVKTNPEEEEKEALLQGQQQEGSIMSSTKEEGMSRDMQLSSRSRARRKSKPRKSS